MKTKEEKAVAKMVVISILRGVIIAVLKSEDPQLLAAAPDLTSAFLTISKSTDYQSAL